MIGNADEPWRLACFPVFMLRECLSQVDDSRRRVFSLKPYQGQWAFYSGGFVAVGKNQILLSVKSFELFMALAWTSYF